MKKQKSIRLLIVDDHPALRKGLREVEEINSTIEVVGEAGTGAEAVKQASALQPEVVLLDNRLPDLPGHEICRRLKEKHPTLHVLFLSSYAAESTVRAAFNAGASGYLLKENDAQKIVDAILAVARGEKVVDPTIAHTLLSSNLARPTTSAQKLGTLSAQERKVIHEVATGKTDKEISGVLGLQTKTIRNYLDHIFAKLEVHTRTEAAAIYLRASSNED